MAIAKAVTDGLLQRGPSLGAAGAVGALTATAGAVVTISAISRELFGSDGFDASKSLRPTTLALTAGGLLLAAAGPSQVKQGSMALSRATAVQGAGAALILAGVGGIVVRPITNAFGRDPVVPALGTSADPEHGITSFGSHPVADARQLAGVPVATAKVTTKDHGTVFPRVYLDVSTSKQLPEGTTLEQAVGLARQRTQDDYAGDAFRAHAVVQTADGRYWTVRLSGDLDQIDGPKYAQGNDFAEGIAPQLMRRQQSLVAIVGASGYIDARDAQSGDYASFAEIPTYTPSIPTSSPSPSASASPTVTTSSSATPSPTAEATR